MKYGCESGSMGFCLHDLAALDVPKVTISHVLMKLFLHPLAKAEENLTADAT